MNTKLQLPANRVVFIFHQALIIITIIGIFIAALENAVPKNWQNALVALGAIITALGAATATTLKFLSGSQNWDSVQANLEDQRMYHQQRMSEISNESTNATAPVTGVTDVTDENNIDVGNVDPSYSPEHNLAPEVETPDAGPEVQKTDTEPNPNTITST